MDARWELLFIHEDIGGAAEQANMALRVGLRAHHVIMMI